MSENPFKKAERKRVFLKLALTGPSGAGKTLSALLIAHGMGKKITLVDTENESASLYAGMEIAGVKLEFDTLPLDPPYTTKKYIEAIQAAEQLGYEVLILDSITHAWKGEGGLLEQKEALDARGKSNSFANWSSISKLHSEFISRINNADIHVLATMRSKQDYILVEKDGKQVPKKVGLAPEQRDGIEYEFSVVFDLAQNHSAEASKDRTNLFDGQIFTPTPATGKKLIDWLATGKDHLEELRQTIHALIKGTKDQKLQAQALDWLEMNKASVAKLQALEKRLRAGTAPSAAAGAQPAAPVG